MPRPFGSRTHSVLQVSRGAAGCAAIRTRGPLPAAALAPARRPTPPHAPPSRCPSAGLPLEALEEPLPGPARRHFRAYWRLQQRVCAGELQPGGVRGRVPPGRSSPADPWPTLVPAVLARPPRSHPAVPGWPGVQPLGPVLRVVSAVRACWQPQLHVCFQRLQLRQLRARGAAAALPEADICPGQPTYRFCRHLTRAAPPRSAFLFSFAAPVLSAPTAASA